MTASSSDSPPRARRRIVPAAFCRRPALEVAPQLLGMHLCISAPATHPSVRALRITEVEAYIGPEDLACHASKGRTARTEPMFAPGGVWYVYLIYGMYEMLNLVTGPRDFPAAILIRGVDGLSGPGRLTRALGIDRRFNARPASRATGLWIEQREPPPDPSRIRTTPRIGVDYAGPDWSARPYRFLLD